MATPQEWYQALPPVTKFWLSAAVLTGFGTKLNLFNPYLLVLDLFGPVTNNFVQPWRLLTNFLCFGVPSFGWLIQMMMLSRLLPAYENSPYPSGGGPHNGNLADVIWMLVFGAVVLTPLGFVFRYAVLAIPLFTMVIYVWSRRHPEEQTSFYMFSFKAAYLPWVMALFTFIMNGDVVPDIMGIVTGHLYYVLQEELPNMDGPLKGWHLLATPSWLYRLLQLPPTTAAAAYVHMRTGRAAPPEPVQPRRWGGGRQLGHD